MNSEKIVFLLPAMLVTISPSLPSSTHNGILRRSWKPDTLESREHILLGIRLLYSESVRSGKGEPLN